jgi:hypothetical protein
LHKGPQGENSFTTVPSRAGRARRRRGGAEESKQKSGIADRTHVGSVRVGGLAGEGPGDGRRQGSGGASAAVRVPVECGAGLGHVRLLEYKWRIGKSFEPLAGHKRERRRELSGGANAGRWRIGATHGCAQGKGRRGFYRPGDMSRRFRSSFMPTVTMAWARRRLAMWGEPAANGGRRRGVWRARGGRVAPA